MAKYHNKKVVLADGTTFDSKKEYERFKELQLLERAGVIKNLDRQVRFELVPAQYEIHLNRVKPGKPLLSGKVCVERPVYYVADFVYIQDGQRVVEDVKSKATKTPEYIIKRKLMRFKGIKIREIE